MAMVLTPDLTGCLLVALPVAGPGQGVRAVNSRGPEIWYVKTTDAAWGAAQLGFSFRGPSLSLV
jgi:hypothetical protein